MGHKGIRIVLLSGVLFLRWVTQATPQSVYVPLNHWSYHFIERLETKGVISRVLDTTRPYTRAEMAQYLAQIIRKAGNVLNEVERKQLESLKIEFKEELTKLGVLKNIPEKGILKKILPDPFYRNGRNFYSFESADFSFYWDPILFREASFSDTDTLQSTEKVYQNANGFTFWGRLGRQLGFFFDTRDTKEWGTKRYKIGNYTLPGLGFVRATSPDFIYHDETVAYIVVAFPYIQLEMGKNLNSWGPGHRGNLILSSYATSYDQFKIKVQYKNFKFSSIYGFLINFEEKREDELQEKKYMAAHRLEFSPFRWLDIGLGEVIIFAERGFEPAYLNPIMFYRSAEHYLGSPDNAVMGFDFKCNLIKNLKFYGELLIDDITTSKLGTGWYGNKYGYLGGLFWVDPLGLPNADLRLEYTRIRPYVYSHTKKSINYTHYASPLGHWIGPNSDDIYGEVNYRFSRNMVATFFFELRRHGANPADKNVGGDIDQPHGPDDSGYVDFLEGIRERWISFGLDFSYEVVRNLYLRINFLKTDSKNVLMNDGSRGGVREIKFALSIGLNE